MLQRLDAGAQENAIDPSDALCIAVDDDHGEVACTRLCVVLDLVASMAARRQVLIASVAAVAGLAAGPTAHLCCSFGPVSQFSVRHVYRIKPA